MRECRTYQCTEEARTLRDVANHPNPDEDETEFWLSLLGSSDLLVQSDEDILAGRTYGEAEGRAILADMSAELDAAVADYASENTVSGEQLRRRYGLPP